MLEKKGKTEAKKSVDDHGSVPVAKFALSSGEKLEKAISRRPHPHTLQVRCNLLRRCFPNLRTCHHPVPIYDVISFDGKKDTRAKTPNAESLS